MQVEQNFIELNYNGHFKGKTKKGASRSRLRIYEDYQTPRCSNKSLQKESSPTLKSHTKKSLPLWKPKVHYSAKSEILRAVMLKRQVFWDVTLCRCASSSMCFERSWCLHIQVPEGHELLRHLETSETIRLTTRRHILDGFDRNPILNHVDPDRVLTF